MREKKLLPLGSVVQIGNAAVPLVIVGYGPEVTGTGERFHYIGIHYPVGLTPSGLSLFNMEDITAVRFVQDQDEAAVKLTDSLSEIVLRFKKKEKG